jgi:FMN-dependent NADH-azoreductase
VAHLLSISVSTRAERSFSNRLREEFESQFLAAHPGVDVVSRFTGGIAHLDFEAMTAGRTPRTNHDERLVAAYELADELTTEFITADAVVISTPMYNWGPPSSLKAWLDRIINFSTFYQPVADLSRLPVTVIISSGGLYSEGENAAHDFLRPLLRECFTRIGIRDLVFVNCDPAGPIDAGVVAIDAPDSGYAKALRALPAAVARRATN